MREDILHELIDRYEKNLDLLYGPEHNELFKWKAVKCWRNEWYKPDDAFTSFADRFSAAKKEFLLFTDNSTVHPSAGVLKLWEKEPVKVESLFYNVLFTETEGDINAVQQNMNRFVEEYNALLHEHFPAKWTYKQDIHSASVYLAMNDPEFNYVYKNKNASEMSNYIGFEEKIGSGKTFSLRNYYKLCEVIVNALKQHDSLLEKHFSRLTEEHYRDESLHLLAFDLMYCCRTYGFYIGLVPPEKPKKTKQRKPKVHNAEDPEKKERERQNQIIELEKERASLDLVCQSAEEISLIGIQVRSDEYGTGEVIAQDDKTFNKIKVRFDTCEKTYLLHSKYSKRPRFENDNEIVRIFTEYSDAAERIRKIDEILDDLR